MSNKTPWCTVFRGQVVTQNKWSETHVSSSGGGGYMVGGSGQVNAPRIRSSVTERSEIFIRDGNGEEHVFHNLDISLRDGSNVLLVYGKTEDHLPIEFFYEENLDTRQVRKVGAKIHKGYGIFNGFLYPFLLLCAIFIIVIIGGKYKFIGKEHEPIFDMVIWAPPILWGVLMPYLTIKRRIAAKIRSSKFIDLVINGAKNIGIELSVVSKSPILFERK